MAKAKINLLPKELAVSEQFVKMTQYLKTASYVAGTVFVIVLGIGIAANFIFLNNLNKLKNNQTSLTTNIQSLQETEQQLILTRDRLSKIQSILGARKSEEIFEKQRFLLDSLPPNIDLESSEIDASKSILGLSSVSSKELNEFFLNTVSEGDFNRIILDTLDFNATTGYKIDLEVY